MRTLIQRVKEAYVNVEGKEVARINQGLLIFFATTHNDSKMQIPWLTNKIVNLRIFTDEEGKLNLSLKEVKGEILVVSQFTLYGDCAEGRRPSFTKAQEPASAILLYDSFIETLRKEVEIVKSGIFGAKMEVGLINDGPVTFIIDSKEK
jgi:D-aminoacyl-tRNA deacylase